MQIRYVHSKHENDPNRRKSNMFYYFDIERKNKQIGTSTKSGRIRLDLVSTCVHVCRQR